MVTKTQILLEKLQAIYDRAMPLNTPRSFFLTLFEYVEVYDTEPVLESITKQITDKEKKEAVKLSELEEKAAEECRKVYKQIKAYVEKNNITNQAVLNNLSTFEGFEDGTIWISGEPAKTRYGSISYMLMSLVEDTTANYLDFTKKFGDIRDDRRIYKWTFSPSYDLWEKEYQYTERIKLTKIWYSWDKIALVYGVYRDYEKIRDKYLEEKRFWNLAGLSDLYKDLMDTMDYRNDQKIYLKEFNVGEYKIHLQRVHIYAREQLLTAELDQKDNEAGSEWRYDTDDGTLTINGSKAKFRKGGFRASLLNVLAKNKANISKRWSWDEIYEKIEGSDDIGPKEKMKVYEASKGITEYIATKTGAKEFLIYDTNTVKVNPIYHQ